MMMADWPSLQQQLLCLLFGCLAAQGDVSAVKVGHSIGWPAARGLRSSRSVESSELLISSSFLQKASSPNPPTFQEFYGFHAVGAPLWKWSNSLDAFQRHVRHLVGRKATVVELQEPLNGSLTMWRSALGPAAEVVSVDTLEDFALQSGSRGIGPFATLKINGSSEKAASSFSSAKSTDASRNRTADVIIEGSAQPWSALDALQQSFPLLRKGGLCFMEELHGPAFVDELLVPAAAFLGAEFTEAKLASVHMYPFLFVVRRAGESPFGSSPVRFSGTHEVVRNYTELFAALPRHPGGYVVLENESWDSFLKAAEMATAFKMFAALYDSAWSDDPEGCSNLPVPVCTLTVNNSNMQAMVTGVHLFPSSLIVELAGDPVVIEAVRRGSAWLDQ